MKRTMKNSISIRAVTDREGVLEYQLYRKKVKNVNLRVRPDGSVMVSANSRVPLAFLDEFVCSKSELIRKAQQQYRNQREKKEMQYVTGEKVRLLGQLLTLKLRPLEKVSDTEKIPDIPDSGARQNGTSGRRRMSARAVREGDYLYLYAPEECGMEFREKLVFDWYRKEAADYLPEVCRRMYPLFAAYNIPYPEIRIRRMTSRWGSCQTRRGVITLSTMLMEVPEAAVEYVVVHEFAHFLHPDHSARFYGLVEKVMPDWKSRRALLSAR